MAKKVLKLTPPLFYYHHRGKGPTAYRTFVREAGRLTRAYGCVLSTEVGQMGDLVAEVSCPNPGKLRVVAKKVRAVAHVAAKLQGVR